MKRLITGIGILFMVPKAGHATLLEMIITDIPRAGSIIIGVYSDADQFRHEWPDLTLSRVYSATAPGDARMCFSLPRGIYAIRLFLDGNGNGKPDPGERYGYARNPRAIRPSWEDCSFIVSHAAGIVVHLNRIHGFEPDDEAEPHRAIPGKLEFSVSPKEESEAR